MFECFRLFPSLGAFVSAVVAAAVLSSCAHGPQSLVSSGGRLDIVNGLTEPVEVFVSGARVALLEPGNTAYLDRLPRRTVPVDAIGVVSGDEHRRQMDLSGEDPARWRVEASVQQQSDETGRKTGVLIVENRAGEPVRPFLDGQAVELVYPDARVAYTGLPLGRRVIEAVGVKTDFRVSMDVDLGPGATAVFVVEPPAAAIRVLNHADLAVRVHLSMDGDETFRLLKPGEAWVVRGLADGETLRLRADDALQRPFWHATIEPRRGQVLETIIPSPSGSLSVVSEFDEPATILADGRLLGTCPAQGAADFMGLVPGEARVQAFLANGTVLARSRIAIRSGEKPLWFIRPGSTRETGEDEGGLQVFNRTGEVLLIQIDGWDRGRIEIGQERRFDGLMPGLHAVAAAGTVSRDVFRMQAEVVKGSRLSWMVFPGNALLALRNLRDEAVRVMIDEKARAEIDVGASLELRIPSGEHVIEVVGVTSLAATRHRVDLPASGTTRMDLARPFASVRVMNLQSSAVEVSSEEGLLGVVNPGETVVFDHIFPGNCRLSARSTSLPVNWNILTWLAEGEVFDWALGAPGTR